jgi:hypothetical protein
MGFFHQKNGIFLVINGRVAKRKRLMAKIRGRVGRRLFEGRGMKLREGKRYSREGKRYSREGKRYSREGKRYLREGKGYSRFWRRVWRESSSVCQLRWGWARRQLLERVCKRALSEIRAESCWAKRSVS